MTKLSNELESERSVCAIVYVRKPVGMRRVSALESWFLSPVSTRRSADWLDNKGNAHHHEETGQGGGETPKMEGPLCRQGTVI